MRRCLESQNQHDEALASLQAQRQQLLGGSRVPSPTPSVTSSLLPSQPQQPQQPPLRQLPKQQSLLPPQKLQQQPLLSNYLPPHSQQQYLQPQNLPDPNVTAIGHLVAAFASQSFDPKKFVKAFKGNEPTENFQKYSLWRSQWNTCEKKMRELKKDNFEMYTALTQCVESEAARVIQTATVTENTYELMLKKLDDRYSNPALYLKEVTKALESMPQMTDNKDSLMKGINTLECGWENLKARDLTQEQLTTMYFLHMYEPKMSPKAQSLWLSKRLKFKDDKHPLGFNLGVEDFFETLHDAEIANLHAPHDSKKNNKNEGRKSTMFGAHSSENQEGDAQGDAEQCIIPKCKSRPHKFILRCPMLAQMTPLDLLAWVKKVGISCKLCLSRSHPSDRCDVMAAGRLHPCNVVVQEGPRRGTTCGGLHCKFLHFDINPKNKNQKKKEGEKIQAHQSLSQIPPPPPPQSLAQGAGYYGAPEQAGHSQQSGQLALPPPQPPQSQSQS